MKTLFTQIVCILLILISSFLYAQVPQQFNYQGIARDEKGNPIAQQRLTLKISLLAVADATLPEYEELHEVKTNDFGLYTLQIGTGDALQGEMNKVQWETGNKYIRIAIDPKGGNDFVEMGTTQLLSVPYAIYANKAGSVKGSKTRGLSNYIEKTDASGNVNATSQLYDNGTNIGIGTTSPVARVHVQANSINVLEHIRMQNTNGNGAGRFTMYSDLASNYATFTKYGSTATGSYAGLSGMYPYANLLAFGNNGISSGDGMGRFLISTAGNLGMSIFKGGTSRLKFHVDYATERIGIAGNSVPAAQVHFNNTAAPNDTIKFTNTVMGHTTTDGFDIRTNGNNARLINRENAYLLLGTNNTDRLAITGAGNVGIGTVTPAASLDVNGQIRIQGGTPGAGKVLTSDSSGLATWQTGISGNGTLNFIPRFAPSGSALANSQLYDNAERIGLGTTAPNAKFHVNADLDTAGFFASTTNGYAANGILRGEYIGTSVYDHVGVYGKVLPDSNNAYGIGVRGDGGYAGGLFLGITKDNFIDAYGVYCSGVGNADVFGVFGAGVAEDTTLGVGQKIGVFGAANGGAQNRGLFGVGESKLGTEAIGVKASANGPGLNYGVWAGAPSTGGSLAGYFDGNVQVAGNLSKSGGTFKIDHPQDPANKYLIHSFVESPDMKNIYDGTITTNANGVAIVQLPAYFEAENKDYRYQLTVIGKDARAYVSKKIQGNAFEIRSSEPNTEISWQVTGIRNDAWAEANRVVPEVDKVGLEKGKYIHPNLFGQPVQQGIHYNEEFKPSFDMQTRLKNKNSKK